MLLREENQEIACTDGDGGDRQNVTGVPIEADRTTHQFRLSGDTVFNLNWDLAHVRHDAFSSLDRSP